MFENLPESQPDTAGLTEMFISSPDGQSCALICRPARWRNFTVRLSRQALEALNVYGHSVDSLNSVYLLAPEILRFRPMTRNGIGYPA